MPGVDPPLLRDLQDARARLLALTADLDRARLLVPHLPNVNPPLWELGHVAWFQEWWLLRGGGRTPSIRADADDLFDSMAVAHATRWDLALPDLDATFTYLRDVLDAVLARADRLDPYFVWLATHHEDMHCEAFLYTWQALGYPRPRLGGAPAAAGGPCPGEIEFAGGGFRLGAEPGQGVVFDNEKWAHAVTLRPFTLARAPVTQAEYAVFVAEGGYQRRALWSEDGWAWRERVGATHPVYWVADGPGRWLRRDFDAVVPLLPHRPVMGVSWYEAEACCRFLGGRLPTEAEWERAAAGADKRRYPWGDRAPDAELANLDGTALECADVGAHAVGDSAAGCRQMLGNVWEWTASAFLPYPGFEPDPYAAYSQPWFGDHRVLRGGAFSSRARMLRNTWRNFYRPWRRDVFAGFRVARDLP